MKARPGTSESFASELSVLLPSEPKSPRLVPRFASMSDADEFPLLEGMSEDAISVGGQGNDLDEAFSPVGPRESSEKGIARQPLGADRVVNVVGRLGMEWLEWVDEVETVCSRRSRKDPVWLDFENPKISDMNLCQELFNLHPVTVEDCFAKDTDEKVEYFDNYILICFHIARQVDLPSPAPAAADRPFLEKIGIRWSSSHDRLNRVSFPSDSPVHQDQVPPIPDSSTNNICSPSSPSGPAPAVHYESRRRKSVDMARRSMSIVGGEASRADDNRGRGLRRRKTTSNLRPPTAILTRTSTPARPPAQANHRGVMSALRQWSLTRSASGHLMLPTAKHKTDTFPIKIVVFDDLVLSFHLEPAQRWIETVVLDRLRHMSLAGLGPRLSWSFTAGSITYILLDAITDQAVVLSEQAVSEIQRVENSMRQLVQTTTEEAELLKQIMQARRQTVFAKSLLVTKRDIMQSILSRGRVSSAPGGLMDTALSVYLHDVMDKNESAVGNIERAKDSLATIQLFYHGRVSLDIASLTSKTNRIIRWTSLFAPIVVWHTLIAGLFSQNIDMPFQTGGPDTSLVPFWCLVAEMVFSTILVLAIFLLKGWL